MLWNYWRKLNRSAVTLRLSKTEKAFCRLTVTDYMSSHPVRISEPIRQLYWQKQIILTFKSLLIPKFMIPVILILAVALSGGTAAAAQSALPGDTLYVVKTEINESVLAAFRWSEEKKVEFQERLIEKRLDERAELIGTSKITSLLEEKVAKQIEKHVNKTKELVTKLEKKGNNIAAESALGKLSNYLATRQAALEKAGEAKPELKAKVEELKKDIEAKQVAMALKIAEIQQSAGADAVAVKNAAQVQLDNFAGRIADTKSLFADAREKMSPEQIKKVEEKLAATDKLYAEAKVKFVAGQYFDSLKSVLAAHKEIIVARQLIAMKNWEKKLDAEESDVDNDEDKASELKEKEMEKAAESKLKAAENELKAAEKVAEEKAEAEEKAAEIKAKTEEKLAESKVKAEEKAAELKKEEEKKLKDLEEKD